MKKTKIPIFWPYVPKKKIMKEISDTLNGRWLGQGPKVDKFEKEFGKKFGYQYPLFVNSGTSALELAYHLIGLKEGDEVICSVLNCTAGQMGLKRLGVKIIFADINKEDLNISFEDMKNKLTSKTRAVVAVALGGIDIDKRIYPYLKKYHIPLILDAAQHHEPKRLEANYVCFIGSTPVTTENGQKQISDVKVGDRVLTSSGKFEEVLLTHKNDYKDGNMVRVWYGKITNQTNISSTENHPIKVFRNGEDTWLPIKEITVGDMVYVETRKCDLCDKRIPFYHKLCKDCNINRQVEYKKYFQSLKNQNGYIGKKNTAISTHYYNDIIPYSKELERQGFRVIPIGRVIPDIIAIKDGRIFAVEVENKPSPRLSKELKYDEVKQYYDEVLWKTSETRLTKRKDFYEIVGNFARVYVKRIKKYKNSRKTRFVYNITVNNDPTYFARKVLVHNCYSFQAIKHITTCDGGMLCLTNQKEYKRAKLLRWFGIDRDLKKKHNYQAWERREMTFDVLESGFKMQPTDVDACFGLASLPDLEKVIKYRRELAIEYLKQLEPLDRVSTIVGGSCWLFGIFVEERDELAGYLTKLGIENNLIHLRNDIFSVFGGKRLDLPNMDWVEPRYLYLPINPKISKKDVKYICNCIKSFYGTRS